MLLTKNHTRPRVLIVDDEPAAIKAYSRSLTDAGVDVDSAKAPGEAMRRINVAEFDVLLSKWPSSEKDLTSLKELRDSAPDVPVIATLEQPNNDLLLKAAQLGVVQYLFKPIEGIALRKAVELALDNSRPAGMIPVRTVLPRVSMPAAQAKNDFARLVEEAYKGKAVFITKHSSPKAVVLSFEKFQELSGESGMSALNLLTDEFNALFGSMQSPHSRAAMKTAFDASPSQLGKAAVKHATKRG